MPAKKSFISYSRADKEMVERLVTSLRNDGMDVWYDNYIRGGENWEKKLKREIRNADIMIMVMSVASENSENVNNEMHYAKQTKTRIIPIKIEDCEPPLGLASTHFIDFIEDYDSGYDRLVADIKGVEASSTTTKESKPKKKTEGKRSKLFSNIKAKIIGIVLIVVLGYLGYSAFQPIPKTSKPITSTPVINIESKIVGRYVILGPNPGGLYATHEYDKERFLWHHVVIHIQNDCTDRIYVEAGKFQLFLSPNTETSGALNFSPTSEGLEFQTKRLPSQWLEPGKSISGDLYFKVPERKLSNGLDMDKTYVYNIVRYSKELKCEIKYTPY